MKLSDCPHPVGTAEWKAWQHWFMSRQRVDETAREAALAQVKATMGETDAQRRVRELEAEVGGTAEPSRGPGQVPRGGLRYYPTSHTSHVDRWVRDLQTLEEAMARLAAAVDAALTDIVRFVGEVQKQLAGGSVLNAAHIVDKVATHAQHDTTRRLHYVQTSLDPNGAYVSIEHIVDLDALTVREAQRITRTPLPRPPPRRVRRAPRRRRCARCVRRMANRRDRAAVAGGGEV